MMLRTHLALTLFAVLLSACSTTPPNRYYLLDALAIAQAEKPADNNIRLGIGTISLPDYLNRPQLVSRGDGARLLMRDGERWAEPLDESVRRVLGENLSRLLGPGKVIFLPAPTGVDVTNRLQLEITAFETKANNEVHLNARWSLSRTKADTSLRESRVQITIKEDGASAIVDAMNQALLQLAAEIATESNTK